MQANPNKEILNIVLKEGLSIVAVSGFEVKLALALGFPGSRIFLNGNGKQKWEMSLAIENGCIMNVDSVFNARQLVQIVQDLSQNIEVLIRLNVDVSTSNVHPYMQTGKRYKFLVGF